MEDNENADYSATNELIEAVNSNLLETAIDLSQIDLKAALLALTDENLLLTEIPILKWMISGVKIASNISTILSIRKFSAFIKPIKDSGIFESKGYKEKLEEICGSKKKLNFVIEQTLFSLDKYDAEIKAKWLAKMFVATFKEKKFSVDEYNAIQFSINSLNPITSISALEIYYQCRNNSRKKENYDKDLELKRANADFSPLVLSGFLHLPKGGTFCDNPAGAFINDLGIRFYENIILDMKV
ncbi:hypothetical protein [Treponema sp.]|uniref:hypothetical protein n=1 Tax=Treponema sp. TaxID=166 RepID=UPI00257AE296|nr:hypothetical protein [Treponema sp.]MBE6354502.1 hypothetical protein [Treponema sp.]